MTTYWRIDHAGWELSRSHRSEILDGSGREEGTSCCYSLTDLAAYVRSGAYSAVACGSVDITELEGEYVGDGCDGEPTVLPTREVARWHHPDWDPDLGLPESLPGDDWVATDTIEVER